MYFLGTLITNFIGPFHLAKEIGQICAHSVLENHSLGRQSLDSVWVLAFTILRTITEQIDFAFEILDPINSEVEVRRHYTPPSCLSDLRQSLAVPHLEDLPDILAKNNKLTRIDRYLFSLEELLSFFLSVHQLQISSDGTSEEEKIVSDDGVRFHRLAKLEASRAQSKIRGVHQICQTYMNQYETRLQLVRFSSSALTGDVRIVDSVQGDLLWNLTDNKSSRSGP